MKPIPLIRLSIIMPTIKFLEGIGTPVQRYLSQAHIPIAAIETAETLISLPMAMTFMGAAAAGEGIENIGIAMGQAAKIADVGLLGQLVCQSFTLYDALQQLCHLSQIALSKSGDQLWLIEEADRVWFCQRFPSYRPSDPCLDHSVYYSLALQLDGAGEGVLPIATRPRGGRGRGVVRSNGRRGGGHDDSARGAAPSAGERRGAGAEVSDADAAS